MIKEAKSVLYRKIEVSTIYTNMFVNCDQTRTLKKSLQLDIGDINEQ